MNNKYLSLNALSDMCKIDRRTIRKKLMGLKPIDGEKNSKLYETSVVLPLIYAPDVESLTDVEKALQTEALKLAKIKSETACIELAKLKQEYVSVETVGAAVDKEYTELRAALFEIPNRVAHELSTASTYGECRDIVRDGINEALQALQKNAQEFIGSVGIEAPAAEEDSDQE